MEDGPVALVGGTVVVGSGGVVLDEATVVVAAGRVASVGQEAPPSGSRLVDVAGQTILPGLIDAHVHLTSLPSAEKSHRAAQLELSMHRLLQAGFTTVRDLGAVGSELWELRERARSGAVATPRLVLCGQVISAVSPGARAFPGMYREAVGAKDLRAAVVEQGMAGADVVKVMQRAR